MTCKKKIIDFDQVNINVTGSHIGLMTHKILLLYEALIGYIVVMCTVCIRYTVIFHSRK